jgi:uncharacterized protein
MIRRLSRRRFLKLAARGIAAGGLGAIGGGAYITQIEPAFVSVSQLEIKLPHLAPASDGLTLAQISDLHLGEWMNRDRLLSVVRQVNALTPDIIAITGDFVSVLNPTVTADLAFCLSELKAREKIVASLGNHDHWTDAATVRRVIAQVPQIQLLDNSNIRLERSGASLYIAGVDDIWEKCHDLGKALADIPTSQPIILLAHEPDYADEAAAVGRVGLQLSGHTHGGQFCIPGIGALVLPPLGLKYASGLFDVQGMALYVNRGLGMVRPLVRFNCRPEITLFTLRS